ncbi:hypothetical protein BJV74DRAFT_794721 [Russula compacta]|nr:hypothetical protein BJV74DRAFT_794721 [Russula compacta]
MTMDLSTSNLDPSLYMSVLPPQSCPQHRTTFCSPRVRYPECLGSRGNNMEYNCADFLRPCTGSGSAHGVSILGARFAMGVAPFCLIPSEGTENPPSSICIGNCISERARMSRQGKWRLDGDFGVSRFKACRPLPIGVLRLPLMAAISQMSVMGIIAIPGMI